MKQNRYRIQYKNLTLFFVGLFLVAGCNTPMPKIKEGGRAAYTSSYSHFSPIVGSYDISQLTKAPLRKIVMMHFDQPVDEVFHTLLTKVDLYSEGVIAVDFEHTNSANTNAFGVGSVRICTFDDKERLFEPLKVYEEHKFYAYTTDASRSSKNIPVEDVLLFYIFEEKGPNQTLVTVRAYYNPNIFGLGAVVQYAFNRTIHSTFDTATKKFNGRMIHPDLHK